MTPRFFSFLFPVSIAVKDESRLNLNILTLQFKLVSTLPSLMKTTSRFSGQFRRLKIGS